MEFMGEAFGLLALFQETLTFLIELFVVWINILEMLVNWWHGKIYIINYKKKDKT